MIPESKAQFNGVHILCDKMLIVKVVFAWLPLIFCTLKIITVPPEYVFEDEPCYPYPFECWIYKAILPTWSWAVVVMIISETRIKTNVTVISPGFGIDSAHFVLIFWIEVHTTTVRIFFTNSLAFFGTIPYCHIRTGQVIVGDFLPVRFI